MLHYYTLPTASHDFLKGLLGNSFVYDEFSWRFILSPSLSGVLQVSISLKKVELSVGESKFFTCTGQPATVIPWFIFIFMLTVTSVQDLRLLYKFLTKSCSAIFTDTKNDKLRYSCPVKMCKPDTVWDELLMSSWHVWTGHTRVYKWEQHFKIFIRIFSPWCQWDFKIKVASCTWPSFSQWRIIMEKK